MNKHLLFFRWRSLVLFAVFSMMMVEGVEFRMFSYTKSKP